MDNLYTPRRAAVKRWLEDAPPYVLDVFDHPKEGDRYTVFFTGDFLLKSGDPRGPRTYANARVQYLGMNGQPEHPSFGVSQWGEMSAHNCAGYRQANGKRRIKWKDLPEHIRQHVIARAKG